MIRLLLPLALLATQAPTIALSPAEGAKSVHTTELKITLPAFDITINSTGTSTFSKVTDAGFEVEEVISDVKVVAGGQELSPAVNPVKVTMGKDGTIKSMAGGVEGANQALTYILFRFVPTPAETGKTTTVELKGNGSDIPDQKVESTYIGPKKVDAGEGFEFKQKTTANELVVDTDYVVKADGTILEATTKFTGLPVPAAGGSADGTGTMKLKP
ncbi:hypothetical protein EON81_07440 [bacterium]|nr:MAG: hypothetical protein EON81_07440 [bacterium]